MPVIKKKAEIEIAIVLAMIASRYLILISWLAEVSVPLEWLADLATPQCYWMASFQSGLSLRACKFLA
jgi:hypothetical protein